MGRYGAAIAFALIVSVTLTGIVPGQAGDVDLEEAERIEVAAGNAHRGPWRMNESNFDFISDSTVAVGPDGRTGVAWADHARQNIFFQMYTPEGELRFETPTKVSSHPGIFSWLPRMVIPPDEEDHVYVLWQEIIFTGAAHGGDIFFARSTDGGESFSEALNLSTSEAGAGKGRLTKDYWDNGSLDFVQGPDGRLYAAWSEYSGRLWTAYSEDGGKSFSEPLLVANDAARPARAPALAVAGDGTVNLAWTVGEDESADIRIAVSTDNGESFSAPRVVAPSNGHSDAPKLAVDSQDRLHLVYGESPEGPRERYHLRYARRDAGEDTFSEPREIVTPEGRAESVAFPSLAVDAADRLYLTWEVFPDPKGYPRGMGFTVSSDGGETFAPPKMVPGSADPGLGVNGNLLGSLMRKIAVNGDGTLALVSNTFKRGESSHIWLWRLPAD